MEDLKRVIRSYMDEAIAEPENIYPNGDINWNSVEADAYARLNPVGETVVLYFKIFDEISEEYLNNA